VQSLNLKSGAEWSDFCKSEKRPENIPASPRTVYKDKGWISTHDWLGKDWRSFEEARAFVQNLDLKSSRQWLEFCKSRKRPEDIPANPNNIYKDRGWEGWGDWLGTGLTRNWRSFEEARVFARSLNLKSSREWKELRKSGKLPENIPAKPDGVYKDKGWENWGDWLGTKKN